MTGEIAVVGGGIAGASAVYHVAARTSRPVVLYERGDLGGETTARSAAFFGEYGSDLERRMKRYGMRTYNDLFRDAGDLRYEHVGRLRVATTPEGADSLRQYAADDPGVGILDPDEVDEVVLVPDLDTGAIETATYRSHVGYLRPTPLPRAFVDRARARSDAVRIETGAPIDGIEADGGGVVGLIVDGDFRSVDRVVCAAGPWNPRLLRSAGVDLPVWHSLAPVLRLDVGDPGYTLPVVSHHESGVYVRGDEDGTVLVGHYPTEVDSDTEYDPDEVPDRVPDDRREAMREVLSALLPSIADASVVEEWVGVRSHTPDGHPIAGETSVGGLSVVAFNSSGIQLAPAVGRVVANGIAGRADEFGAELAPERFD